MIWIAIVLGLILGHLIRRATPYLIFLADKKMPFSWPGIELMTAAMFAIAQLNSLSTSMLIKWCLCALILVAAMASDYYKKVISDWVCYTGIPAGILLSFVFAEDMVGFFGGVSTLHYFGIGMHSFWAGPVLSVCGLVLGFVSLEGFRRIFGALGGMEVMGMGDSLLLALVGSFVGPGLVLFSILPASIIGMLHWPYYRLVRGINYLPFGPGIAMSGYLMAFYHVYLLQWIDRLFAWYFSLGRSANLLVFLGLFGLLIILVFRIRARAAHYSEMIEKEYQDLEAQSDYGKKGK
ncbi:MAG: prepilin peptidase [Acidobacteria bacterium]|nr:prepilin peptidase [Acidobacteriota bacterium]